MGFADKLKGLFNKIFVRNKSTEPVSLPEQVTADEPAVAEEEEQHIELPEGEIVSFSDEVLDTKLRANIEKLRHNLEILIKKAKEAGKVDKFMLIREDNFFPTDWEWRVLSKDTNLEMETTSLSYELRKAYVAEQNGIKQYTEHNGIKIPIIGAEKQIMEALLKSDKTFGNVLLPSRFRSTKHFTVNTPLEITGDYNSVTVNRDFIIIDNINAFLESGYAYSVAYHDAYLDISHESLPISEEAIVLIDDEKYDRIMSDEKVASELSKRRVVRYKGDSYVAINMVLTEMGVLPSTVGTMYAEYDRETYDILDSSIRNLAQKNNLFFDKGHAGELKPDGGHFSSYYDGKNKDYEKWVEEFIDFLRKRFPEHGELFPENLRLTGAESQRIVEILGINSLFDAINEYNELARDRINASLEEYKKDRQSITPEIHKQFTETISLINDFYKHEIRFESYEERLQIEGAIQKFLQGRTVKEQLEASKSVWELLSKNLGKTTDTVSKGTISMSQVVANAVTNGTSAEHVENYHNAEHEESQKGTREEETK